MGGAVCEVGRVPWRRIPQQNHRCSFQAEGYETEANTRLLLDVENPENPVEIVIHVNMLKEGWDVNNLYTIVPLRTAASKILRGADGRKRPAFALW